jgi:Tfp pilus assembly protein PilX
MKILKNKGIATLPIVIVLGMMVLAVVVSITSTSFNGLMISQGQSQSSNALFYAESGARDALTRIARDKNYTCSATDCYSLDFITNGCMNGTDCAKVSISNGIGTTADPKIITSKGIMKNSTRVMQVSVTLDGGTIDTTLQNGEITSAVWTELTI